MSELKAGLLDRLNRIKAPDDARRDLGGFSLKPSQSLIEIKHAAVLIACVEDEEPHLILTVRSHEMPHHAGQVGLPGGRIQAGDATPTDTALREAEEEIGLERDLVEVLGQMPVIDTITGFRMTPVVGWVASNPVLRPCDREVRTLFRVPLAEVLNPSSYSSHRWVQSGSSQRRAHRFWRMRSAQWPVWGATAQVLACLAGLSGDELAK